MKKVVAGAVLFGWAAVLLAGTPATAGTDPRCSRELMPTLPGTDTYVSRIEPTGRFQAGSYRSPTGQLRVVLWTDGVPADLGIEGGDSGPAAVDSAGQVIGGTYVDGVQTAWRLRDGVQTSLPTPAATSEVKLIALGKDGQVAGEGLDENRENERAVIWATDNSVRVLPPPAGFNRVFVTGITDDGSVVGTAMDWDWPAAMARSTRAVVWDPAGTPRLLPASKPGVFTSAAIVKDGKVWGTDDGVEVRWTLGVDEPGVPSDQRIPNARGSVLGSSAWGHRVIHADGTYRDLPSDDEGGATTPQLAGLTDDDQVYGNDGLQYVTRPYQWDCS
jgi:hypothetical protein